MAYGTAKVDTLVTSTKTVTIDNILVAGSAAIVNADVSASAAIAGTKISPNFGAQAVTTSGNISATSTGTLSTASGNISSTSGSILTSSGNIYTTTGRVGAGTSSPSAYLTSAGGTTTVPPLLLTNGSLLTSVTSNAFEYDGINLFHTGNDTTNGAGRTLVPEHQFFRLSADGSGITSTASPGTSFFGATNRPALLAGEFYEFEYYVILTKTTATTAIFQFSLSTGNFTTISASTTGGFVAFTAASATITGGAVDNGTTSPVSLTASGTLATGTTYAALIKGFCIPVSNARLDLLVYNGAAGTITPQINSYYKVTCLGNVNSVGNLG